MKKISARRIANTVLGEFTLLWDEAIHTFMNEKADENLYERIVDKEIMFYGHKYRFKVDITMDYIYFREIEVQFMIFGIVGNKKDIHILQNLSLSI